LILFRNALHLYGQQLTSRSNSIFATALASALSVLNSLSLENRRTTIENEDRLDTEPEKFTNATEETNDMRIAQGVSFLVTHGFEKLVDPDRGIDGEALTIESRKVRRPGAWLDDRPKTVHTHSRL
jgi:hypothetical protein